MRSSAITLLLLLAVGGGTGAHAQSDPAVRVLDTWPQGDNVTLAPNENFHLRLGYTTDTPIRIWARPYFRGQPAKAGSHTARRVTGSGESLGWFFLQPGAEVDEVRITAGDGSTGGTPVVATWRGRVVAGGSDTPSAVAPAWVAELRERDRMAQQQAATAHAATPANAGDVVIFGGFMLAMLALGLLGFAAPVWGLWRWRGAWRIAAAVPAAVMGFVVLRIVVDVARDPTSHNLWPFEILQAGAFCTVVMAALLLARRITGAGRTGRGAS